MPTMLAQRGDILPALPDSDYGSLAANCTLNGRTVPCSELSDAAGAAGMVVGLIWLIGSILCIVSMWKIFTKANKPGWASIIPIYNLVVMLEMIGKPVWWIILLCIPFVNIIIIIITMRNMSKVFGKGGLFTIGLILLPIIFFPILAFGKSTYKQPAVQKA